MTDKKDITIEVLGQTYTIKTSADKKGTSPFIDPILPKNDEISPNDKPGFGIEIDDEILAKLQAGPKPDPEELRFATTRGWQWPPYL